jgi:DNA-binding CsgD family transcriptional regulator
MQHGLSIGDSDRARLRELARTAGAPHLAQRCNIILASASPDTSAADIAQRLGTSPATVRRWQRQFAERGVAGLADARRPGAPRQIDERTRTTILDLHAEGLNTRCIAGRTGISQSSISRIVRQAQRGRDVHASPPVPIEKLVEQLAVELFDSLADEVPLTRFLDRIKQETGSGYGIMLIFPQDKRKPSLVLTEGEPLEGTLPYIEKYYDKEILVGIPEGVVTTTSDLLPQEEFRATELYREYLVRYGVGYILGVDIGTVRGVSGSFRLSRLETDEDFGPRERAICQGLVPYLRAALNLFVQRVDMEAEKEALSLTVSGMSVGSITVDPQGHVLEANPPALAILHQQDGLFLTAGKIALHAPSQSKQLHDLIRRNAEASIDRSVPGLTRAMLVDRPSGKESFSLLVRPAVSAPGQLTIRPTALIHLVDPAQPRVTVINALIELFGLTPAEAKVAVSLSNGLSIADTACQTATSTNTIRAQVRSIFSKMGVNRQSQLIRTTLISVALFSLQHG